MAPRDLRPSLRTLVRSVAYAGFAACACAALGEAPTETVEPPARTVIAGRPEYEGPGSSRSISARATGSSGRLPFAGQVLDLKTFAGGLTPVRQVGSMQSIGLALKGADGRSYTFRTLDKDPTKILPAEWRDSFRRRSSRTRRRRAIPAARSSCPRWPRPRACPTPTPTLVFMPDDPALGEFRRPSAARPGSIDEYPLPAGGRLPGLPAGDRDPLDRASSGSAGRRARRAVDTRALLRARMLRPVPRRLGPSQRPVALDAAARARRAGGAARGPRPGLLELLGPRHVAWRARRRPSWWSGATTTRTWTAFSSRAARSTTGCSTARAGGLRGDGARRAGAADRRSDRGGRPAGCRRSGTPIGGAELIRDLKKRRDLLPAGCGGLLRAALEVRRRPGHGPGRRRAADARGGRKRPARAVPRREGGRPRRRRTSGAASCPGRRTRFASTSTEAATASWPRARGAGSRCACRGGAGADHPRRLRERRHALLRRRGPDRGGRGPGHRRLDRPVDARAAARTRRRGWRSRTSARSRRSSRSSGGSRIRASCCRWAPPTTATVSASSPIRRCSALARRVQDQARRVRRELYRRLPLGQARLHHLRGALRRRRQELQLLRVRERDRGHRATSSTRPTRRSSTRSLRSSPTRTRGARSGSPWAPR